MVSNHKKTLKSLTQNYAISKSKPLLQFQLLAHTQKMYPYNFISSIRRKIKIYCKLKKGVMKAGDTNAYIIFDSKSYIYLCFVFYVCLFNLLPKLADHRCMADLLKCVKFDLFYNDVMLYNSIVNVLWNCVLPTFMLPTGKQINKKSKMYQNKKSHDDCDDAREINNNHYQKKIYITDILKEFNKYLKIAIKANKKLKLTPYVYNKRSIQELPTQNEDMSDLTKLKQNTSLKTSYASIPNTVVNKTTSGYILSNQSNKGIGMNTTSITSLKELDGDLININNKDSLDKPGQGSQSNNIAYKFNTQIIRCQHIILQSNPGISQRKLLPQFFKNFLMSNLNSFAKPRNVSTYVTEHANSQIQSLIPLAVNIIATENRTNKITFPRSYNEFRKLISSNYISGHGLKLLLFHKGRINNIYKRIILDICYELVMEYKEVVPIDDTSKLKSSILLPNPSRQCTFFEKVFRCLTLDDYAACWSREFESVCHDDDAEGNALQEINNDNRKWNYFSSQENNVLTLVIEHIITEFVQLIVETSLKPKNT